MRRSNVFCANFALLIHHFARQNGPPSPQGKANAPFLYYAKRGNIPVGARLARPQKSLPPRGRWHDKVVTEGVFLTPNSLSLASQASSLNEGAFLRRALTIRYQKEPPVGSSFSLIFSSVLYDTARYTNDDIFRRGQEAHCGSLAPRSFREKAR